MENWQSGDDMNSKTALNRGGWNSYKVRDVEK